MQAHLAPPQVIPHPGARPHDTSKKSNKCCAGACVELRASLEKLVRRAHYERLLAEVLTEVAAHGHA